MRSPRARAAGTDGDGGDPSAVPFPFHQERLDNGLTLLVQEDHRTPVVAVHLMYHVGSKDERPGRTGFAHLFEHLLFQGSEHVPKGQHFRHVQNAGGTLNGSTWFDRTNYFEVLPASQLELALWLESDRMGWFLPSITREKLDNQRDVVKNERRQAYENRPYGLAFETVLETAFPEGHPYRHPTIGYMEDLDAADLEDVREFFRRYYGPDNAVLVIAGDVETGRAVELAGKWFGGIPGRGRPPEVEVPDVGEPGERRAEIEDRVQVPRVYLMHHAPSFNDEGFEASDVLSSVLADGKSSRLHHRLIYEERVAGEVTSFVWPTEATGMLWTVATARPGVPADELEASVRGVLDDLRDGGVEGDEVAGARNRARRSLVRRVNDVGGRADTLAHAFTLRGDPGYLNRAFGRYAAVERSDVESAAREILRPERLTVVRVVPEDGGEGAPVPPVRAGPGRTS